MQVRCPQCQTPVELASDGNLSDIVCPSCGSSFSLLGTEETAPYEREVKTIGHFDLVEQVGIGTFGSGRRSRPRVPTFARVAFAGVVACGPGVATWAT
jgi:hypothetical protein